MSDQEKYAFDFIDVRLRPSKPRTTGLTIVRDRMRGLSEQREFLETYGQFVDYVKISNMTPRLYSEAFLREKLALYKAHDVKPFFGGILLENAWAQGKADRFFDYVISLECPAIEISDNIIDVSREDLTGAVSKASNMGLEVFFEWGEKYPTRLFDPQRAAEEINACLEAGASYAILERAEIDLLFEDDQHPEKLNRLVELADLVGRPALIFEVETQAQMVGLLTLFGADANLGPNIDFELVKWLEPSRLGISREMGHTTINEAVKARSGKAE